MTKQEILDYLNQYRNAGNHIHREAMDAAIEAFEIADRLEQADAREASFDYCDNADCDGVCDECRIVTAFTNGYEQALKDIRSDYND